MAEQFIKNPSITPGDLNIELSGGYVTAISGHPVGGTGGGGGPSVVYSGVVGEITVDNQQGTIGIADEIKNSINSKASKVELNTTYNTLNEAKQDKLTFGYDDTAISSINGSALAGTGGGDYTAGIDLKIENGEISVDTNGNPNNTASNTRNFVEGSWTVASGYNSHAEGVATSALGYGVHAQGMWTKFSSSKWSDSTHDPVDIYWADGAGATVEGYCNATTSCPMSGTEGQEGYGPIHGGIIKVIGNGYREHKLETDPATYYPSDALIIFRDGTISAFGDIFKNDKKYVTEDAISSYNVTAQQGVEVTPQYDSTNKTITFGISITATPVVTDTTLSGYNGIAAAKDGNVSGQWNVGLTNNMLNTINGKLDSTVAAETYQQKGDYASETDLQIVSAGVDAVSGELPNYLKVTAYAADSATFALKSEIPTVPTKVSDLTDSANYYKKSETSGAAEISTALDNKVDKPDTTQVELNNKYLIYSTLSGAGQPKGWVDMQTKVYSKTEADGTFQKKTDMGSYLTTAQYATDSATYVTETELEAVSGEITALIPTNYVTSGNYISGNSQYALTSGGWAKVQAGSTLTPGSGIDIVSNEINVKLGKNLKFTNSNNTVITTEDNLSAKSFGVYTSENYYTKIDKDSITKYSKTGDEIDTISLNTIGLETIFTGPNRNISANYDVNHLFFKSYDNDGEYSGNYSQIEMKVLQEQNPAATQHKSTIVLTDYDGTDIKTGLIDVASISAWNAATGGSFTGVTTNDTLTGDGTGANNKLGIAWSALSSNTINSAKSAEYITNGVGYSGFNDISAKFDSLTSYVPYSATELPIGTNNTATTNAAAIGGANSAIDLSFALGNGNSAKTTGCAIGEHNYAYNKSVAIGYQNTADYNVDIAIGYQCSSHDHAATFMDCNTAKNYSFAAGHANTAENYSFLLGRGLKFSGDISNGNGTALGSFVIGGWNNTTAGNALFVVGNGSSPSNKSDAFIVYRNGAVNAGNVNTNTANGANIFVFGNNNGATGTSTFVGGGYTQANGTYNFAYGDSCVANGYGIVAVGFRNRFNSTDHYGINPGTFVAGRLNNTTAHNATFTLPYSGVTFQGTDRDGVLAVFGNGKYTDGSHITSSDAMILFGDGTLSAKQFMNANGIEDMKIWPAGTTTASFTGQYSACLNFVLEE